MAPTTAAPKRAGTLLATAAPVLVGVLVGGAVVVGWVGAPVVPVGTPVTVGAGKVTPAEMH